MFSLEVSQLVRATSYLSLHYRISYHRASCPNLVSLKMNEHHRHPNYVCKPSGITPRTNSQRLTLPERFSLHSSSLLNIKTHPKMNSMWPSEPISLCSTNMTPLDGPQPIEELDTRVHRMTQSRKKTLLERLDLGDQEVIPLSDRGLQRSEPLTNPFSLGSRMTQPTKLSSP